MFIFILAKLHLQATVNSQSHHDIAEYKQVSSIMNVVTLR